MIGAKTYARGGGAFSKRMETLLKLVSGEKMLIVVSAETIMQRMAPPELIRQAITHIEVSDTCDIRELLSNLISIGYKLTEICQNKGEVSLIGGRIDIFPVNLDTPFRIEFFDDEIDTMRSFDKDTQRSIENILSLTIAPATELPLNASSKARGLLKLSRLKAFEDEFNEIKSGVIPDNIMNLIPLFILDDITIVDYFTADALILIDEPARVEELEKSIYSKFSDSVLAYVEKEKNANFMFSLLISSEKAISKLDSPRTAMFFALTRTYSLISTRCIFRFESRSVPRYSLSNNALVEDITSLSLSGFTILVYAGARAEHLQKMFEELNLPNFAITNMLTREIVKHESLIIGESLGRGFIYPEIHVAVITENELFLEVASKTAVVKQKKRPNLAFTELKLGDYVVHETYGIGRFMGVETMTVEEKTKDYIKLQYAATDKVFLPTDQLDRVQKYIGGNDEIPKLSKLGSAEWHKTVSRARASVKSLAFDLVKLYGARANLSGHAFSEDTVWQGELENSFPYNETPDQLTSIAEIKKDMESSHIMDRLLCGDVGYGKTEVALRAAFKAVMDGKQVAFLVPTTLLAQQHFNTLSARYRGFPVSVEFLSRFKTPKEQENILKRLKDGRIDVIIGTHKLLGKNVLFKDLGLLIIDEEQRFGVGHKEQIKNFKSQVDVLTLSATPIPRTLHMSLINIRDMSVIETPPEERIPVQTYVIEYSDVVIREVILKEMARGGQVFFVYNKVRNMETFSNYLFELVPEARICYAHGQMGEHQLERTMLSFLEGNYDVLLCSTIIESGLDIQNANTIIVYDADKMGLSQLYQLKGRVGRSTRLGYAYFTFKRDKVLTEIAEKRLMAIREFTEFGAGYKIAMRDLEIRGAGDLLGAEQHGRMADIGYELYCKLMGEAVNEVRGIKLQPQIETQIEIGFDAFIPRTYIKNDDMRLNMYKRIAALDGYDSLYDVQDELIDRFGEIPQTVTNLLLVALIKALAQKCYIVTLRVFENTATMIFASDAPFNFKNFLDFISTVDGAQMLNSAEPTLTITSKNADLQKLIKSLPALFENMESCLNI
ncbi:MAG: transcription-repair coupling factor [Clostridia bacterium]